MAGNWKQPNRTELDVRDLIEMLMHTGQSDIRALVIEWGKDVWEHLTADQEATLSRLLYDIDPYTSGAYDSGWLQAVSRTLRQEATNDSK